MGHSAAPGLVHVVLHRTGVRRGGVHIGVGLDQVGDAFGLEPGSGVDGGSPSRGDTVLPAVELGGDGRLCEVRRDAGDGAEPRLAACCVQHGPARRAHAERGNGIGVDRWLALQEVERGDDVVGLGVRVLVLAGFTAALAVVPVVERKRDEPPRRERTSVETDHLFLDRGHRSADDHGRVAPTSDGTDGFEQQGGHVRTA
jgi:hypothetical protein